MLDRQPLLTIVTVTFNDRLALASTLASFREQEGPTNGEVEFIVVDGGSTDGTDECILRFADLISSHVSESDRGIYHAMNKGLRMASGRFIMYMNCGDVFYNYSALGSLCKALNRTSCLWLIAGAMSLDGGTTERRVNNIPHSWFRHAFGVQQHCHQATIVSRDLLCAVSGFSEEFDFAGDFDLILRIGLIAQPAYLDLPVVLYAGGGISAVNGGRIPVLQHQVRAHRMQLSRGALALDAFYMRYQLLRRSLHPFVQSCKSLIRRFGPSRNH